MYQTYDQIEICLNGIPEEDMTDAECIIFDQLITEKTKYISAVRVEKALEEKRKIEERANAAVEEARRIAARRKEADLAELVAIKKRLGIS